MVDRANCEPYQRANWLKRVTRKEGVPDELVACVVLHTPLETCQERVREREGHFLTEKNVKVVATWHKSLEANYPSRSEGFGGVFTLKSDRKRDAFLAMMAIE